MIFWATIMTIVDMATYCVLAFIATVFTQYFTNISYEKGFIIYFTILLCYTCFKTNKFIIMILTNPKEACKRINRLSKSFKETTEKLKGKNNGNE